MTAPVPLSGNHKNHENRENRENTGFSRQSNLTDRFETIRSYSRGYLRHSGYLMTLNHYVCCLINPSQDRMSQHAYNICIRHMYLLARSVFKSVKI
jgi:hypothetical protein